MRVPKPPAKITAFIIYFLLFYIGADGKKASEKKFFSGRPDFNNISFELRIILSDPQAYTTQFDSSGFSFKKAFWT
jgi:hypothetical protein